MFKKLALSSLRPLAATLFALTASTAQPFQPLITDDTGTQGKSGNQFELGFSRDRVQQGGTSTALTLPFTYTRGLSDDVDVFVSVSQIRLSSDVPGGNANGIGNPSMGFKWRFFENEASKTSLAIKPELRLPVNASKEAAGLGTGRVSYGVTLIATQETGFGAVHANLAAGRDNYRGLATSPAPDATSWRASVSPVWDVEERWKLALDLGIESQQAGGDTTTANYVEFGTVYSPSKDLDFALGIIRRVDRTHPATTTNTLTAGVTWRFL